MPGIYAGYTDAIKRIIPNAITLPTLLIGIVSAIYFGHLGASLAGAAVAFGIYFVMALTGGMGGGDVKLAAAMGAWFGFPLIIYVILLSSLLGFSGGCIKLIRQKKLGETILPFLKSAAYWILSMGKTPLIRRRLPEDENGNEPEGIPFGTYMIIGALIFWVGKVAGFDMPYMP